MNPLDRVWPLVEPEPSPVGVVRERAVPCRLCRRETWNASARCDRCLVELDENELRDRDEEAHGWDHYDDPRYVGGDGD